MNPSKRAIFVCLAGALFFYYAFFQMAMFNSLSQDLLVSFHLQAAQLGNLSGAYFLADAIVLIPTGLLLDRFSAKGLMLIVMGLCTISTLFFAYTTSLGVAMAAHAIAGIGNAFAFLGSMTLASRFLSHKRLALGMGLIITIGMIAGVVAQTPFTLLIQHTGWRHAVMINGVSGILIWVFMLFALKDKPEHAILPQSTQSLSLIKQIAKVARNPQNWICGAYTTLMYLPIVILGELWGVMYLTQARGFTTTHATNITSMIFLGMMLGSPVLGWFSDKITRRKSPMILTALLTLGTVAWILYDPYLSMSSLMALFFALGFFACGQVISYPTMAECNPVQLTGSALSIVAIALNIGSAITQPLFGWIMHWDYPASQHVTQYAPGDYSSAIIILPVALILAIGLSLRVRETFCRNDLMNEETPSSATPV